MSSAAAGSLQSWPRLWFTLRSTDPQAEFLPPTTQTVYAPGEERVQPPRRSEWDPRSAPATYFLLGVNIAVFLWMLASGVSPGNPTTRQLLHFGADNSVLVLYGHQWWRVLTAMFVHIGILHIASNMWCLWNLGLLGEPLIGPFGMVAVYVLTGLAGNLLSIATDVLMARLVYNQPLLAVAGVGAGASGAVFGIAGILILLLSNKRLPIPWTELKRLRTSVVRFALINLVIGASTVLPGFDRFGRIDNSAHIGGFLAGMALGPGLMSQMTAGRDHYLARQQIVFVVATLLLALFGYWLAHLI